MMSVKEFHGSGAFFYPPITVYENESDKKLGRLKEWKKRKIMVDKFYEPDFRVLVTDDGGICPLIESNRPDPFDFLNVVFATLTITTDYPSFRMHLRDWSSFTWIEGEDHVKMNQGTVLQSIRTQLELRRDEDSTFISWTMIPREPISKLIIENVIDLAHNIYVNSKFREDILFFGETHSLFSDELYTASFLYSWMLIENFLERSWIDYVDLALPNNATENKILKEFIRQTSDNYIKLFTELKKIDTKGCQALHKLREIRNDIIHEKYTPTKNETYDCMMIVLTILTNRINGKNPFDSLKLEHIKP